MMVASFPMLIKENLERDSGSYISSYVTLEGEQEGLFCYFSNVDLMFVQFHTYSSLFEYD